MLEVSPESESNERQPSPWPATFLAIAGGFLAVASIRLQHYAADFGASACLLASWWLTRSPVERSQPNHPLAKPTTQKLLLAFAILTALIGGLRLVRG